MPETGIVVVVLPDGVEVYELWPEAERAAAEAGGRLTGVYREGASARSNVTDLPLDMDALGLRVVEFQMERM